MAGATGYLGRRLVPELVARGHRVRALVRGGEESARRFPHLAGVEVHAGDLTDPPTLVSATRGVSTVVHLVGIIRQRGRATFDSIHVQGTTHLVQAARHNGCERLLYVSALGARRDAPSAYARTKAVAEELVRASGLVWLILRPSIVFARDGEFYRVLRQLVTFPLVPILGPGTSRFAPIAADDLARLEVRALERPETWQRAYDVCGPASYSFDDLVRMTARGLRRPALLVHLPLALVRPLVSLATALVPWTPITSEQLQMLEEGSTCEAKPVERAFGLAFHPIEGIFAAGSGR